MGLNVDRMIHSQYETTRRKKVYEKLTSILYMSFHVLCNYMFENV